MKSELRKMKFYNPGKTRWLTLSEKEVDKIVSLFKAEVEELVVEEMLVANKEGQVTSRLTSLWAKISKL